MAGRAVRCASGGAVSGRGRDVARDRARRVGRAGSRRGGALSNAITGYSFQTRSGSDGGYAIESIPPNTYRLRVSLPGFRVYGIDVAIRSAVPVRLDVPLEIAGQQTSVTVESSGIVENTTIASDIVDQAADLRLPALSPDSGLNDAILSPRRVWRPIRMVSFTRSATMRRSVM